MARTANVPGVVLGLVVCLLVTKTRGGHYLNQYAVDVHPGQDPDVVAKEAGCENTGKDQHRHFLSCSLQVFLT